MAHARGTAIVVVLLLFAGAVCSMPAGAKTGTPPTTTAAKASGVQRTPTVDHSTLTQLAVSLLAASDRPSPEIATPRAPTATPGDSGNYACTKLAAADVAAVAGGRTIVPRPNGGGRASGALPATSVCVFQAGGGDAAAPFMVTLTAYSYPSADAARQALYDRYGDTDSRNIPGVGNGAFIFPNGSPAYVAVGSDVVQLDLIAPPGTDTAAAYTALLRSVAKTGGSPASAPTPPVPGKGDLDPCLLTPAEVQKIFGSGPVTRTRTFADESTDHACAYQLTGTKAGEITVSTFTGAALAGSGQTVQDRYAADLRSTVDGGYIPGFPTPAKPLAPKAAKRYATVWGFGTDNTIEVVAPDTSAGAGGSSSQAGRAIPPSPLLPDVRTRRLRMSPGGLWDGRGIVVYAPTQLLDRPDPWDLAEPDELPGP